MKHKRKHSVIYFFIIASVIILICLPAFCIFRIYKNNSVNTDTSYFNLTNVNPDIKSSEDNTKNTDADPEHEWYLLLVNNEHSIPENYRPELTQLSNGKSIDSRIYPYLQEMFDDMRNDGVYPVVAEGYRTSEEQRQMMDDKIDAYMYEGLTYEEAEKSARLAVAEVGKSEHQLGLSVDINSDDKYSSDEEVYDWLFENAYKYGFILRYPADKTDITGIEYEPWHYRYTGKKAAKEIHSQGVCLEEYLQNDRK